MAAALVTSLGACNTISTISDSSSSGEESTIQSVTASETTTEEDILITSEMNNDVDGEHVIEADNETVEYSNTKITKTGDSDEGDEADFYGDNAAVFATNGANLTLSEMVINTNGKHANGVFSYGSGTTVTIKDSDTFSVIRGDVITASLIIFKSEMFSRRSFVETAMRPLSAYLGRICSVTIVTMLYSGM